MSLLAATRVRDGELTKKNHVNTTATTMLGRRIWRMSTIKYERLPRQVDRGYFPRLANRMLNSFIAIRGGSLENVRL